MVNSVFWLLGRQTLDKIIVTVCISGSGNNFKMSSTIGLLIVSVIGKFSPGNVSKFNRFAKYKTARFRGFRYDGHGSSFMTFSTDEERNQVEVVLSSHGIQNTQCKLTSESCENLFYHLCAYKKWRKIKISKFEI